MRFTQDQIGLEALVRQHLVREPTSELIGIGTTHTKGLVQQIGVYGRNECHRTC